MVPAYDVRSTYTYDTDIIDQRDIPRPLNYVSEGDRCMNCGRKL